MECTKTEIALCSKVGPQLAASGSPGGLLLIWPLHHREGSRFSGFVGQCLINTM